MCQTVAVVGEKGTYMLKLRETVLFGCICQMSACMQMRKEPALYAICPQRVGWQSFHRAPNPRRLAMLVIRWEQGYVSTRPRAVHRADHLMLSPCTPTQHAPLQWSIRAELDEKEVGK